MTTDLKLTSTGKMILGCHLYETVVSKSPACALIRDGEQIIAINPELFSKFSVEEQRVILYHECGHIKTAHKKLSYIESEYAADGFAAVYLGKDAVVTALRKTIDLVMTIGSKDPEKVKILEMRIEHVLHS